MEKEIDSMLKEGLTSLKNAITKAIPDIIKQIESPIDRELSQEKVRFVVEGKQKAVEAVKSMLMDAKELEERLTGESSSMEMKKKKDFEAGTAEEYAKKLKGR
jgi:hypothetical protein